jgi:hypothetical protein
MSQKFICCTYAFGKFTTYSAVNFFMSFFQSMQYFHYFHSSHTIDVRLVGVKCWAA